MNQGNEHHLRAIDFYLTFFGKLTRAQLCRYAQISSATASRALAAYRDIWPENLVYEPSEKTYQITPSFKPRYTHDNEAGLKLVGYGLVERVLDSELFGPGVLSPRKMPLSSDVVHLVTRAINKRQALRFTYHSPSSTSRERHAVMLALFYSLGAWYCRAFDLDANDDGFRTFRLNRISEAQCAETGIHYPVDTEWENEVMLTLIPHPKHPNSDALRFDLGLKPQSVINVPSRAALVGYYLQEWHVDASEEAVLNPQHFQLCLANRQDLVDLPSMSIAPGFLTSSPT